MKYIVLNDIEIPYNITKKQNKNTYFYFKKDGYIQINLAQRQSSKQALSYMSSNADAFVSKYLSHCQSKRDVSKYYHWGVPYEIVETANENWEFDTECKVLYKPLDDVDQLKLHALEIKIFQQELQRLISIYQGNPHVDISGVTYKIKRMVSRHGSCHKKKR